MTSTYRQRSNTAGRVINGLAFVITPDSNRLHTLNATAAEIWRLAKSGCTVDEAAAHLEENYRVDYEAARRDAATCCDELVNRGILVVE